MSFPIFRFSLGWLLDKLHTYVGELPVGSSLQMLDILPSFLLLVHIWYGRGRLGRVEVPGGVLCGVLLFKPSSLIARIFNPQTKCVWLFLGRR
jgi:hypothetical protein